MAPSDPATVTVSVTRLIRLLLADDHPVVRAGLRAVLETEPDFIIAAEASTAAQAVTLAAGQPVDVVLMDLRFGAGMDGARATAEITARPGGPRVRAPGTALSLRETEVLQLVAEGLSNSQISRQLFVSEATVKSHLVHIYGKLNVDSRTAAVAAARAQGLIRP